MIKAGFAFEDSFDDSINTSIQFSEIYENIFKNKDEFLEKFYNYIFKDEDHFEENEKLYNNIKEIIDKYYREYGLSIDDFTILKKGLIALESVN